MKKVLYIDSGAAYRKPDQVKMTMTVGELMEYLAQFDKDTKVYRRNDGGYTYEGITRNSFKDDTK